MGDALIRRVILHPGLCIAAIRRKRKRDGTRTYRRVRSALMRTFFHVGIEEQHPAAIE
jgi:hypothetical protein